MRRTGGWSASPFYQGKLRWFERMRRWLDETRSRPDEPLVLGGDYNVTRPTRTSGTRSRRTAARTSPSPNARRSPASATGACATRTGCRSSARAVHVVGLPRRHVPQATGHAHRPAVRHRAGGGTGRVGRDRPRGAQGAAGAVRPRARRRSTSTHRASRSQAAGTRRWRGSRRGRDQAVGRAPRRCATSKSARRATHQTVDRRRAARSARAELRTLRWRPVTSVVGSDAAASEQMRYPDAVPTLVLSALSFSRLRSAL